jgi:hypothetical protein
MEAGRKENRTSQRIPVLGLYIQRESHGQGTHERDSEEGKQGSGMSVEYERESMEVTSGGE